MRNAWSLFAGVFLIISSALTGCGAGTAGNVPAVSSTGAVPLDAAARDPEPDAGAVSSATSALRSQPPPAFVANSLRRTHGRTPQSIVQEDDHSDVGVTFSGGNRYTGIYSIHSVYTPNEQLNMTFPAGQSGQELLYSPTTKMPDGGCLENGTYYLSVDPAQTFAGFYIFDFCGTGGFVYFHDIDAAFHRAYVRNLNDVPSYVVQELADRRVLTANTVWTTYLYNFASSRWDAVFSEAGRTGGLAGWSIFESYYLPGHCPSLPTMQARQIQLYDPQRGWIHVTASMPDTSVDTGGGGTLDCFNLAPVSYKFTFVKSNWWWRVSSTGN